MPAEQPFPLRLREACACTAASSTSTGLRLASGTGPAQPAAAPLRSPETLAGHLQALGRALAYK